MPISLLLMALVRLHFAKGQVVHAVHLERA